MSFTNSKNEIKSTQNKLDKIEYVDPEICWAGANAVELYSCGNIGCNFNVWADTYSSCMGY